MMEYIIYILAQFLAVIIVLTFHEFAHAYAAYKCGDQTAKFAGRMTLNPVKHFDPLGVVMFAFAGFGWAKPVPINPNNFKDYKKGSLWTSSAGVLTNYLMAFLFYPLFLVVIQYVYPIFMGKYMGIFLLNFFWLLFSCSLSFCVFNLLPVHPLDGFRIVDAASKTRGKLYYFLRDQGYYLLLGLIFIHMLAGRIPYFAYIDILGYVLEFAVNFLGKPITLFWDWIFRLIIR